MTSFFAGFAVFSILGYIAKSLGTTVDKVVSNGKPKKFMHRSYC